MQSAKDSLQFLNNVEHANKFAKYLRDPVGFIHHALGEFAWSKQREICEALRDNRRVAVKACHAPGKSWLAARLGAWWLSTSIETGDSFLVTSAPTFKQVEGILWREMRRAHRKGNLPGRMNRTEWLIDEELVAFGRKPADADMTAFQGIHARRVLVIFDEACGIPKTLYDAGDTLIANEASRMLAIGNPDDPTSEFARICQPGSGWKVITISAFDTPNFTGEDIPDDIRGMLISPLWVEEKRKAWGENSFLWDAKIMGEFPEQDNDSLVPLSILRKAVERDLPPPEGFPVELGVDVSRFGGDHTVIYSRQAARFRCVKRMQNRDLMAIVGEIVILARDLNAKKVKIDDAGLGGGVTDRLKELKDEGKIQFEVVPINVGEGATSDEAKERFVNLRAELNWTTRQRFMDGDIDIDDNDNLLAQASSIRYEPNSRGQIKIEAKADMKKRGLPSPDDWDALVLADANPARPSEGWFDYWKSKVKK